VSAPPEIKVFISNRDGTCSDCGTSLGHSAWIHLDQAKGAVCLPCADLDHLEFLPTGDAALTRRAKQASTLRALLNLVPTAMLTVTAALSVGCGGADGEGCPEIYDHPVTCQSKADLADLGRDAATPSPEAGIEDGGGADSGSGRCPSSIEIQKPPYNQFPGDTVESVTESGEMCCYKRKRRLYCA
jgi:hypothetical protein